MSDEAEFIDRERPCVSEEKARLDRLDEAARELERVKKAKARNTWEKREQAYGTAEEVQSANRILEQNLTHARGQTSDQDIQEALETRSISDEDAARLREYLHHTATTHRNRESRERE